MRHAGPEALARLSPWFDGLRSLPGLRERGPGVWYRRAEAFLHFHEDGEALWADLKLGRRGFTRLPASSDADLAALRAAIEAALAVDR